MNGKMSREMSWRREEGISLRMVEQLDITSV